MARGPGTDRDCDLDGAEDRLGAGPCSPCWRRKPRLPGARRGGSAGRRPPSAPRVDPSPAGWSPHLRLTDLALVSDASYCRHPSQADRFAPFSDHPGALEHFPGGSLVPPPARERRAP